MADNQHRGKSADDGTTKTNALQELGTIMEAAGQKKQQTISWLRKSYDEMLAMSVTTLAKVAGGDGDEDWVTTDQATTMAWEDLLVAYKSILRKCKVSILDAELKATEHLVTGLKDYADFFGIKQDFDVASILFEVKRALLTRLSGVCFKILLDHDKDKDGKLDTCRSKLRTEIMECEGEAEAYGIQLGYTMLPKALLEKVKAIIDMVRR